MQCDPSQVDTEIAVGCVRQKVPSTPLKPEGREDRGCVEPLSTIASWNAKPWGQNSVNFCHLIFTGQESSVSNRQEKASREHRQHRGERKHRYTFPGSFRATPRAHALLSSQVLINCYLRQQQGQVSDKQRIEHSAFQNVEATCRREKLKRSNNSPCPLLVPVALFLSPQRGTFSTKLSTPFTFSYNIN